LAKKPRQKAKAKKRPGPKPDPKAPHSRHRTKYKRVRAAFEPPEAGNTFLPTQEQRQIVMNGVAIGVPHAKIARVLNIAVSTMKAHFKDEMETGKTMADIRIGGTIYRSANGSPAVYDDNGNLIRAEQKPIPSLLVWWSKCRMGWKEAPQERLIGGIADAPIQQETKALVANIDITRPDDYSEQDLFDFYRSKVQSSG
jgi:hypothetical protein